ncbi:hypothetical protein GCM10011331_15940 [Flavimobilis marinus]|uniref:Adenylate cyclase, class 3 n=1 Tax=Flavimobilis marinus TaxID=285351 RepID=A0A1I2FMA7_9MICO|nr:adenylate/guanylate cyclase domain-containing protein [Flavimobilis marinus]GHG51849.1 hypothetical protein GCM10011331_15940 [Flavimobilis marinus]SFF05551.1 Adenylate cyclase, class 3 [Flavimobilis marinus]
MPTLKDQVEDAVSDVAKYWIKTTCSTSSTDVPDPDDMGYSDAKVIQATYLYSDLRDSSGLLRTAESPEEAASVMSAFLKVAVRIVRAGDGHIRSFDGDRVMGVFVGPRRATRAVQAAMKIKYATVELLNPEVQNSCRALREADWTVRAMTGVASGEALLVRAGIRNNNDLLSVGAVANLAAKLSDVRDASPGHDIAIGAGTYGSLEDIAIMSAGKNMWTGAYSIPMGGRSYEYYTTSYRWAAL